MSGELMVLTVSDIERMGNAIAKSGLFGIKSPEQAIALMLVAQAQGRHPASVAMEYDIIQGKPALKSQAALMRFQQAGGKIKWIERTDTKVSAEFSHPQSDPVVVTWDMARAQKMELAGKDNWKKQPMIMLQWRVVAEGVRACYPACLGGSYLVEEVQDFDTPKREMKDITPAAEKATKDFKELCDTDAPEEKPQEPTKDLATAPQVNAIQSILKKLGFGMDDYKKHEHVSNLLKLPAVVVSFNNLSKSQASEAIRLLGEQFK